MLVLVNGIVQWDINGSKKVSIIIRLIRKYVFNTSMHFISGIQI